MSSLPSQRSEKPNPPFIRRILTADVKEEDGEERDGKGVKALLNEKAKVADPRKAGNAAKIHTLKGSG